MSGPHFRDYHLLIDEHAAPIFAMTDDIAERVRKIGGVTIRSIAQICRGHRIKGDDAESVDPLDMPAELREDNRTVLSAMRAAHDLTSEENDVATTSLLETWIDETERRICSFSKREEKARPRKMEKTRPRGELARARPK